MTARTHDLHHRLEPRRGLKPLQAGFGAEVADPVWFLGRQWQLGEHQGANAASPVRVEVTRSETAIEATGRDRALRRSDTPETTLPEALVEGEPDEWWTPGRRIAVGRAAAQSLPPLRRVLAALARPPARRTAAERGLARDYGAFVLRDLPPPYRALEETGWDGRALHAARNRSPLKGRLPARLFADVPARPDHWLADRLAYADEFRCGNARLRLRRHDGGEVDWWSADSPVELRSPRARLETVGLWPARFRYPGSPHPRWWQIEDAAVDVGGYPPDRAHFATMLLVDLLTTHADDWFTFALPTRIGRVVTLHRIAVHDAFGEVHTVDLAPSGGAAPSAPAGRAEWSLFAVSGLGEWSLPLWPTASALSGEPLEQVVLGVDEDANLLWAVEERVDGRALAPAEQPRVEAPRGSHLYRPSTDVPEHWHPYTLDEDGERRRFAQARLANLAEGTSGRALRPLPLGRLLGENGRGRRIHRLRAEAIPASGLRVERRALLARRTDGSPILWVQRRRVPLLAPPSNVLRFDVVLPPGR